MTTPRFTRSAVDPRCLSMLPQDMARQHPDRRRHVHGPIQPMEGAPPSGWRITFWTVITISVALFTYWCGSIRL